MASETGNTSDSLDVTVTEVPKNLQGYVKAKVAEYIGQTNDVCMKIHQVQGQLPKLMVTYGTNSEKKTKIPSTNEKPRAIFIRNIPDSATEDLLEVFFESKKKYGGGPVKGVKVMEETRKKCAIVEFYNESSVAEVLKKKPILFGTAELDVTPFRPLLSGNHAITDADISGTIKLPQDFTEHLLKTHLEIYTRPQAQPLPDRRPPPRVPRSLSAERLSRDKNKWF